MKKFKLRSLVIFALAALSGGALLHTSQNVQHAEEKLHALQSQIAENEEKIRVLKAEWAFLNAPQRLEKLTKDYLDLHPPVPVQSSALLPDKAAREETTGGLQPASLTPGGSAQ